MKTHPTKGKHAPGARWHVRSCPIPGGGLLIYKRLNQRRRTRIARLLAHAVSRWVVGYEAMHWTMPMFQGVPLLREENLENSPVRSPPPLG